MQHVPPEPHRVLLRETPAHEAAIAEDKDLALASLAAPLWHPVRVVQRASSRRQARPQTRQEVALGGREREYGLYFALCGFGVGADGERLGRGAA